MIWGARHQSFNIRVFVTIVHNSVVERLVRCTNSIHCSLVDGIATKKMQIHHLLAQKEGKSSLTLQSWSKVIGTHSLSCHLSPPPQKKIADMKSFIHYRSPRICLRIGAEYLETVHKQG